MKLKCDLTIFNLNNPNLNAQAQQCREKLHKQALIGLYRPKLDDEADSAKNDARTAIILTIETKTFNAKYRLKNIEIRTRFINEGKATLRLVDENIELLISNTIPLTLINFVSFLNVKLAKARKELGATAPGKENATTAAAPLSYANRLLNNAQCVLGKNSLANISPLCEKEINDAMKARAAKLTGDKCVASPIRAGKLQSPGTIAALRGKVGPNGSQTPVDANVKHFIKRSISMPSVQADKAAAPTTPTTLKRSLSSSRNLLVQLTEEQKQVLQAVRDGKNVFFTGSGGSGKSFLIKLIKQYLPPDASFVTASTGAAASLIGGVTIHAFAGLSVHDGEDESGQATAAATADDEDEDPVTSAKIQRIVSRIITAKEKLNNWKKCRHLIIDEISMVDADLFETLDRVAREIKRNDLPFGGIQMILSGDFLQLPPVSRGKKVKRFCFQSELWTDCIDKTMKLSQVKRQKDNVFIEMLEEIRFGKVSEKTLAIFEKLKKKKFTDDKILPTKLCTHKDDVEAINKRELAVLKGDLCRYRAIDSGDAANTRHLLRVMCPAREELSLKLHAQVMLIKNLDVANNLVNGSRGYVTGFTDSRLPVVKFLDGTEMIMKYETWSFALGASAGGSVITRRQIPLQLAYALSIHKSQGMTLDCVELSLSRVFECGQAYVALSRAKSLDALSILDFDKNAIRANESVLKFYKTLRFDH